MLCSAPVGEFGAVDRKQFYVTMSRAQRWNHLYTDSIDGLRQAVCLNGVVGGGRSSIICNIFIILCLSVIQLTAAGGGGQCGNRLLIDTWRPVVPS